MNNLLKVVGFGAISLLAVSGWKFMDNFRRKRSMPTKEETLAVLQTIRVEFYPVLVKIADFVARELVPRGISPQENEKFVMQNPQIKSQIEAANKKAYISFSQEDIKEAMDELYLEDGDILKQKSQFREEYKRSLLGVRPQHKMIASRKVSKKLVLEVISEILEDKLNRLQALKVREMGKEDQRLMLEGDVEQDERTAKQKIKERLGLSAFDSLDIFHYLVAKYSEQDLQFKDQYKSILQSYSSRVRGIIPI